MTEWNSLKHKLLRNLHDYGFGIFLKKSLSYLAKPFYENLAFILYIIDLESICQPNTNKNGFLFRLINAQDAGLIKDIETMEEWLRGKLTEKLLSNALCNVVLHDGDLLGFYLANLGEGLAPLMSLRVILRPDEVWAEQITVSKGHRKEGVATQLKSSVYEEFKRRGIRKVYAATRIYNKASLQSAQKFGIKKAFRFTYIKAIVYRKLTYRELPLNGSGIYKKKDLVWRREMEAGQARKRAIKVPKNGHDIQAHRDKYLFNIKTMELL